MHKHLASVSFIDRLVSCLSYLTAGWAGLIYCVVLFFRKKTLSHFLRYNIFQSIFFSLFYFILCAVLGFICDLLLHVPFLNYLISQFYLIFNKPVFFAYSIIQILVMGLFLYMAVFSLFGKYPRVYWVSSRIIDSAAK